VQGRFTSPDSFFGRKTNPQTLNLYAYVLNNPLRWADPTGHFAQLPQKDPIFVGHLGDVETTDKLPEKKPGLLSRIWGGLKKIGRAIGGATNDFLERDKHSRFPYFQHTDPNAPPPKIMRWSISEPETLPALAAEVGEVAEGATVVEDVLAESGVAAAGRPTFVNLGDNAAGTVLGEVSLGPGGYRLPGGELAEGSFDFVVQGGNLRIGSGHPALSQGAPVEFAGEITFRGGAIVEWTNASGHFRPATPFAGNAGLPMGAFRPVRFPIMVGGSQFPIFR
jgi:hypothetical protein